MKRADELNRRDFIAKTAGTAGAASAIAGGTLGVANAQATPPPGFDAQPPFSRNWERQLREVVNVNLNAASPELANDACRERHRIYSFLLMTLIRRFWNGNKHGPLGLYPQREAQKAEGQDPQAAFFRYRGDMIETGDPLRVAWDRYLGHNIACLAVDGKGEIIDFEFNHNDFFRSSAEHAESRMVRRLFSLTDIFDNWKTGTPLPGKSRAFSLKDVTLYTSLESCAQCSGVMSLGGVKQVVYLQNDFTAYMIGNIMFNLADPGTAPIPIPASAIGLRQFDDLNSAHLAFIKNIVDAKQKGDASRAFFVSPAPAKADGGAVPPDPPDFSSSITSFLCTDAAFRIFDDGAKQFAAMRLDFGGTKFPDQPDVWTNDECLEHAKRFFSYADVEGYRGSPHKL